MKCKISQIPYFTQIYLVEKSKNTEILFAKKSKNT